MNKSFCGFHLIHVVLYLVFAFMIFYLLTHLPSTDYEYYDVSENSISINSGD